MPRSYPPEFRRKVLDLLEAGGKVAKITADLGISAQTIYNWRAQHLIDTGEKAGIASKDLAELVAARRRIAAPTAANWIFQVVSRRYERGSIVLTSNIINVKGKSYRMRQHQTQATGRKENAML